MAPSSSSSSSSSPSSPSTSSSAPLKGKDSSSKQALVWIEWLRGWMYVIHEMLFQRILASHLENPMPLPPINDLTCIVTESTSGIGRKTATFRFPLPSFVAVYLVLDGGSFVFVDSNQFCCRQLVEADGGGEENIQSEMLEKLLK